MTTSRSWRWYVSRSLYRVGDWIMDLGAKVSQWEPPSEVELEQSSMRIKSLVLSRVYHPCPTCGGRGLVNFSDDDSAVCFDCAGHGIDATWLKERNP